jgi:hypothetical protein
VLRRARQVARALAGLPLMMRMHSAAVLRPAAPRMAGQRLTELPPVAARLELNRRLAARRLGQRWQARPMG